MKRPHDIELARELRQFIHPQQGVWTDCKRHTSERRMRRVLSASATGAVVVGVGVLLGGCSRVQVTPLGSTREGRRQFEITCNQHASDSGSCHEKALDACGGDYETLDLDNTGPMPVANNGQLLTAPGHRVLLIACHR